MQYRCSETLKVIVDNFPSGTAATKPLLHRTSRQQSPERSHMSGWTMVPKGVRNPHRLGPPRGSPRRCPTDSASTPPLGISWARLASQPRPRRGSNGGHGVCRAAKAKKQACMRCCTGDTEATATTARTRTKTGTNEGEGDDGDEDGGEGEDEEEDDNDEDAGGDENDGNEGEDRGGGNGHQAATATTTTGTTKRHRRRQQRGRQEVGMHAMPHKLLHWPGTEALRPYLRTSITIAVPRRGQRS